VLLEPNSPYQVEKKDLQYKCGWSPLEGATLSYKVTQTFVNGNLVYNDGQINEENKGQMISFSR